MAIFAFGLCAVARAQEAKPEDIMDAAFDMQKAARGADELAADGAKYCRWGIARLDASHLATAISRQLLNRGVQVPEHIPASKMWRVSFVADDLTHQLNLSHSLCALSESRTDEAYRLFQSFASVSMRFLDSEHRFDLLAFQQTRWQEGDNLEALKAAEERDRESANIARRSVLAAARGIEKAADDADDLAWRAARFCRPITLREPHLEALTGLIGNIERSPSNYFLLATEMSAAKAAADEAEMRVMEVVDSCAQFPAKKNARTAALDALHAHHRIVESIVEFEPLVARQAEWEEQVLGDGAVSAEQ
jgi:hypothetical protein